MNQSLVKLRELMKNRGIDAYIVFACDDHQSEYFSAYYMTTRFLSGFTGESCTIVITQEEAMLWTDGRYFVQAESQMDPEFTLCRMGEKGVPTVPEYLEQILPEGGCLGFDGRMISERQMKEYQDRLDSRHICYRWEEDLVDLVWENRPQPEANPVWLLGIQYTGRSASEKIEDLRKAMKEKKVDAHILASLDDIAWLFNLRGSDIPRNPVAIAYAVITEDTAELFLHPGMAEKELEEELERSHVVLRPYSEIFSVVSSLPDHSRVLVDPSMVSVALVHKLPKACTLVKEANPTTAMRAVKNETEVANSLRSHIRDGVAMVRFSYWLKTHIGKEKITEISAADVLEGFRREQENNRGLSFDTIAGYGPHGAMMHYMATPETSSELKPEGFLLVDSGGQYLDGTTDVTRTYVLGPITDEMKKHFTAVTRGMLNLADAKFLEGCIGQTLDYLARAPIWEMGIDYRCGTGHGVGFFLNVHEGPQGFRWKVRPDRAEQAVLRPGMITTDEPGIYLDYKYGIRCENELLCVRDEETEYGQFLRFRHMTFCPIDLEGIDKQYMTAREVELLNSYHKMVYETLKDLLPAEEAAWLKDATRAI